MVGGSDQWSLELPFGAHVHQITNGHVFYTALYVMICMPNLTPTRVRPDTTVRLYYTGLWVKTTLGLTLRTHATQPLKNVKTIVFFFLSHSLCNDI